MRNNRPITDLKHNTKKRLRSLRKKVVEMQHQWHGEDLLLVLEMDDLIVKIGEIYEQVDGIDVKYR
tara:strand:+ start:6445 stop:6642 length:198 start_codon:yes stop_codon:yes gene_type:complete